LYNVWSVALFSLFIRWGSYSNYRLLVLLNWQYLSSDWPILKKLRSSLWVLDFWSLLLAFAYSILSIALFYGTYLEFLFISIFQAATYRFVLWIKLQYCIAFYWALRIKPSPFLFRYPISSKYLIASKKHFYNGSPTSNALLIANRNCCCHVPACFWARWLHSLARIFSPPAVPSKIERIWLLPLWLRSISASLSWISFGSPWYAAHALPHSSSAFSCTFAPVS